MTGKPGFAIAAPPLLLACGALACLAWTHGLFANTALASLVGCWIGGASIWLGTRPPVTRTVMAAAPASSLTLEADRRRLQAMLDQAPAPLVTLAPDDILRAANRAARRLFATDDRITVPPPGLREAIANAQPGGRQVLKLRHGGSSDERSYALSVATSSGADGATRLAILTDIQAELQSAEAAALRDLLQVLSHEIMNSLTPVTSLAETAHAMLSEGAAADIPRAMDALETIQRRARGLDRFVQGYRLLARVPPPDLLPASIRTLLAEAATLFEARSRDVAFRLDLPETDFIVRLDQDLLTQALLNLLANAAEAARTGRAQPGWVSLAAAMRGDGLSVRVTDSGDGVGTGEDETIFQPFFTSKPGGTGIGLSLARQIALAHGGTVSLDRTQPEGRTSFVLSPVSRGSDHRDQSVLECGYGVMDPLHLIDRAGQGFPLQIEEIPGRILGLIVQDGHALEFGERCIDLGRGLAGDRGEPVDLRMKGGFFHGCCSGRAVVERTPSIRQRT